MMLKVSSVRVCDSRYDLLVILQLCTRKRFVRVSQENNENNELC